MAELSATTVFVAFFALFQLAVGVGFLARRRLGPTRLLAGLLFLVNASASLAIVAFTLAPDRSPLAGEIPPLLWVYVLDAPTGALLLLLAVAFYLEPEPDAPRWPRGMKAALAVVVAGIAAGSAGYLLGSPELAAWLNRVYASAPLFASFAILTPVLLVKALRARGGFPPFYALCMVGFGARPVEFSWAYGLGALGETLQSAAEPGGGLESAMKLILPPIVGAVLAVVLWRLTKGPEKDRRPLAFVALAYVAALVLGMSERSLSGNTAFVPWYALSLVTLVVVRPMFVGAAFEAERTARAFSWLAVGTLVFLAVRGGIGLMFGASLSALSALDLAALAATLFFAPAIVVAGDRIVRLVGMFLPPTAAARLAPEPAREGALTRAQALAAFLADHARQHPGSRGATQEEVRAATGITPNNLAAEVRRCERLLSDGVAAGTPLVAVDTVGVRARKVYRLTPHGCAAAERMLAHRVPPQLP